jgi:hypothetical protein
MEEVKKLKISSPDELYIVLKNNQQITYQDAGFASFYDFMDLSKNGCKCKSNVHYEEAYRIYYTLPQSVTDKVVSLLKYNYDVEILSFFDGEKHIFDL